MLAQPLLDRRDRFLPPLGSERRERGEVRLPWRYLVRTSGLAADREHDRARLLGDRASPQRRIANEDEGSRGRLHRLAADREAREPAHDDVELLVSTRPGAALVVILDDVLADPLAGVRVDAEALDPEPSPHRMPDESRSDRD